jgi:hypothetical protein
LESTIQCKVAFSDERFALLRGGYDGQTVKGYRLGGCLLDGLVPMAQVDDIDYFGLVGPKPPCEVMRVEGNRYMVSTGKVRAEVLADGHVDCRALAFSLSYSVPTIKVIPKQYGQKLFNEGDDVIIRLSLCEERRGEIAKCR